MKDTEKYARVFRAAVDGMDAVRTPQVYDNHTFRAQRAMLNGIATMFEKMREAEDTPPAPQDSSDTARLNWLEACDRALNPSLRVIRNGPLYGTVREAIDQAMKPQREHP